MINFDVQFLIFLSIFPPLRFDFQDSDVRAERVKVFEMDTENESMALIARDLTKVK